MKVQTLLVSVDSTSVLKGSKFYTKYAESLLEQYGLREMIEVLETGSFGVYRDGVIVAIYPDNVYYEVRSKEDVEMIVTEHLLKGRIVSSLMIDEKVVQALSGKPRKISEEMRIVLRNVGLIDPKEIDEYIARDGYMALGKVLTEMDRQQVIQMIKDSGLRGRGGAGFPTGLKWEFTAKADGSPKYVICNADEGEPGTFKDRLIMEGDPHSVIEAMVICAYAVGASKGYIYIRGEYYGSIDNIQKAIQDAYEYGFLGKQIMGSGFEFDLSVRLGAGAYICGEETALIESIEGKPGRPRLKPPYPPVEGVYQKPTVVNNVETFANVPWIILNGEKAFSKIGTENSAGTKVFTLVGNIANRGLVEVPMGTTLHELVYRYGGGVPGGKKLKMVQTGGTAGSFVDAQKLDIPLDFDSWKEGATLGSGVVLALDEDNCAVDIALTVMHFFSHESCGKCTPCREGTAMAVEILKRLSKGQGVESDVGMLDQIAKTLEESSFCGLGQAAPIPLQTILEGFREEFLLHGKKEPCPVGKCVMERIKPKKVLR